MMDVLVQVYHKTCVKELSLLQKGTTKSYLFRKKGNFIFSGHNIFRMINGKEENPT